MHLWSWSTRRDIAVAHAPNGLHSAGAQGRLLVASSPGESHSQALPEPYVNLSTHTAPDVQVRARRRSTLASIRGSSSFELT